MKIIIFLLTFGVYIFTAFPSLAPYRDTGEFTSVIKTLGIAHPPGYPLYTLTGKFLTTIIPFSNFAYRVTVVSALFMAGAVLLMFIIVRKIFTDDVFLSSAVALGFGFSYLYWYHALFQEMYTMGVFFVALILYLLLTEKFLVAFFVFGLATGVRLDTILIYPAVLYYVLRKKNIIFTGHLFFVAGFTVYLYLLIRSTSAPLINWNDPSTISRFISSLTRKTHGGTLDLISVGYQKGENFIPQIKFYLTHLLNDYFYIGIPVALFGFGYLFQTKKQLLGLMITGFSVSGILFIYLANMPPNPHALAILEAHFLLPDLFFVLFLAAGMWGIFVHKKHIGYLCSAIFMLGNLFNTFPDLNKRHNFFLTDYSRNLSASLPEDSIIVIKEDVQLFSMWHQEYVTKKRPDIKPVASGLAGSPWYQKMNQNSNVKFFPLSTADGWKNFIDRNEKVSFTGDVEFLLRDTKVIPQGLANTQDNFRTEPIVFLDEIFIYRGDYRYHSHREFFTPDLIEEYAKAWHQSGYYYMLKHKYDIAKKCFLTSLYMKNNMAVAAYHLGWCYFSQNDFANAYKFYEHATNINENLIILAGKYKAMPDVVLSIKNEAANSYLHKGVAAEKLNLDSQSLASYERATELKPDFSLAYYNKAVIYWKRGDFTQAKKNLELTLRYDPQNLTARTYLQRLSEKY